MIEAAVATPGPWYIRTGRPIPSEGYCDQPYVVGTDDGAWLCLLTTGAGQEGDARQHVVATRSQDQGQTWSPLVDIEPPGPPEASWVMPLKVPGGRVYAIYVYNGENRREVLSDHGPIRRVDTLGQYVFRYSDDGGWRPGEDPGARQQRSSASPRWAASATASWPPPRAGFCTAATSARRETPNACGGSCCRRARWACGRRRDRWRTSITRPS